MLILYFMCYITFWYNNTVCIESKTIYIISELCLISAWMNSHPFCAFAFFTWHYCFSPFIAFYLYKLSFLQLFTVYLFVLLSFGYVLINWYSCMFKKLLRTKSFLRKECLAFILLVITHISGLTSVTFCNSVCHAFLLFIVFQSSGYKPCFLCWIPL